MRKQIDPDIEQSLTISRVRWFTRCASPEWTAWLTEAARAAFREFAPRFTAQRIHSVPGNVWEVLRDSAGLPCLIADDELISSLAELRELAAGRCAIERGYDRMVLLLADGFRSRGDIQRFAVCLGWALPRQREIIAGRAEAMKTAGFSAEALVILFHELAHHVLLGNPELAAVWRELSATSLQKILGALRQSELREQAVQDITASGLSRQQAEAQMDTYLETLQSSAKLTEELTCDLLAAVGFVNLQTPRHLIADLDAGPGPMATKEVGDALIVAHGAIQKTQSDKTVANWSGDAMTRQPIRFVRRTATNPRHPIFQAGASGITRERSEAVTWRCLSRHSASVRRVTRGVVDITKNRIDDAVH